jgi:hypothetical protein
MAGLQLCRWGVVWGEVRPGGVCRCLPGLSTLITMQPPPVTGNCVLVGRLCLYALCVCVCPNILGCMYWFECGFPCSSYCSPRNLDASWIWGNSSGRAVGFHTPCSAYAYLFLGFQMHRCPSGHAMQCNPAITGNSHYRPNPVITLPHYWVSSPSCIQLCLE